MASNFLDKKEIDQLMAAISGDDKVKEEEVGIDAGEVKILRPYRKPIERIKAPYQSPVLKSEKIAFDPKPGMPVAEGKVVVQSLVHFISMRGAAGM